MTHTIFAFLGLPRLRSLLTFVMAIIYLINYFIQSVWINHLLLVLISLVVILSLPIVSGSSRIIGYASIVLSIVIFIIYQAPFEVWERAVGENLYLVVMFTLVPLLRVPIQFGGYYESLKGFFRRFVHTHTRFYLLVSFIAAFIGILVNLAVVPLVHEISRASDFSANKRLLSKAITRGFATCTVWAPTMASIALIIQISGAQWHTFLPYGLLCGVLMGAIGFAITMLEERNQTVAGGEADTEQRAGDTEPYGRQHGGDEPINYAKVFELSVFGLVLITLIVMVSLLTGIHTIVAVSLACLVFPVVWLALLRKLPVLLREFRGEYFHRSLPGLKNEIILFVGAGLFATSITFSGLGEYVPQVLSLVVGENVFLLSVMILLISVLLAALGVHPIVTMTVIGGTVKAAAYGVTPTYMAVLLAVSWALGISVSPSAANIIAVAGLAEKSPVDVGLRWNARYVLVSSVVVIIVISGLRAAHWL